MARKKKGSKATDSDIKAKQALDAVLANPGKARQEIAEELGINRNTLTDRVHRAMSSDEVKSIIETSRRRNLEMLSLCDHNVHRILKDQRLENNANQIKVIAPMYRTFGIWADETQIKVENMVPVQVVINDPNGERQYEIGPAKRSAQTSFAPETGDGI